MRPVANRPSRLGPSICLIGGLLPHADLPAPCMRATGPSGVWVGELEAHEASTGAGGHEAHRADLRPKGWS